VDAKWSWAFIGIELALNQCVSCIFNLRTYDGFLDNWLICTFNSTIHSYISLILNIGMLSSRWIVVTKVLISFQSKCEKLIGYTCHFGIGC